MLLRKKNFNILGVHQKVQLLGRFTKNQYRGGDCLKRGLGQFDDLRGAWQERGGGGVFEGVDTPIHTMMNCICMNSG